MAGHNTPPAPPPHQRSENTKNSAVRPQTARSSSSGSEQQHQQGASLTKPTPKPITTAPPPAALRNQPTSQLPPQPANKMATPVIAPQSLAVEGPRMSMTSKEWVIPPRPKPGRKPATDTPPTKRKAQNRAAQRAFRERRAARVGELEDQLDNERSTHENTELELKEQIRGLELDLQSFRSRCSLLENMLERERQERIRAETEAETLRRRSQEDTFRSESVSRSRQQSFDRQQNPSQQSMGANSASGRQSQHQHGQNMPISQIISPPETLDDQSEQLLTCGNCSVDGPCACAEEALAAVSKNCGKCGVGSQCHCLDSALHSLESGNTLKRPLSPSAHSLHEKRHRTNQSTHHEDMETDMTAIFSAKSITVLPEPSQNQLSLSHSTPLETMNLKDGCGFCKEGTYCVCADAAMATPAMTPTDTLPPITQQVQTPPPSESDILTPPIIMEMTADGSVKLPPRRTQNRTQTATTSRSCGPNGPGTCAQCQADPKSGLFCRLMAARFDGDSNAPAGGCCGGKGREGGCCKTTAKKEKITLPSLPSLGLSCAEAYQTLSSHRNFEQAADDIGSWLPKLRATPTPGPREGPAGRKAIEVEAASIMSVLKDFDVRFGREA